MTSGTASFNNSQNNYSSNPTSPAFPIMSPYLRKNIKKQHGSLNEALATLPKSKISQQSPSSPSTSISSQVSPKADNSNQNLSYSRDTDGPCSSMIVSSLIISVAALFFFALAVQYLSLVPPHPQSVIAVCGGLSGELPGMGVYFFEKSLSFLSPFYALFSKF